LSDGEETKGAGKYTYAAGNDFCTDWEREKKKRREKRKIEDGRTPWDALH
jgi:hypothetical protein